MIDTATGSESIDNVAVPLPVGEVPEYEARAAADHPPSAEFVAAVLARVEIHVAAGNWAVAVRTIEASMLEWQELQREHKAAKRRLPAQWLRRPLHELGLSTRLTNAFEDAGAETIGDCLTMAADPDSRPVGVAETGLEEIHRAARRLGLTLPTAPRRLAG